MEKWQEFFRNNKGIVIGGLVGLLLAILIMTINFWRTLLLFVCIFLGAWIGSNKNVKEAILNFLDKILPFK